MTKNTIPSAGVTAALSKCYRYLLMRRKLRLAEQNKTPTDGEFGDHTSTGASATETTSPAHADSILESTPAARVGEKKSHE